MPYETGNIAHERIYTYHEQRSTIQADKKAKLCMTSNQFLLCKQFKGTEG